MKKNIQQRTWRDEFPSPDFDVPAEITSSRLLDCSWHNDVMPSFCLPDADEGEHLRLWVDATEPDRREINLGFRFAIVLDGVCVAQADCCTTLLEIMLSLNSVEEARQRFADKLAEASK